VANAIGTGSRVAYAVALDRLAPAAAAAAAQADGRDALRRTVPRRGAARATA
jgi:hypothetical protein